MKQFVFTVKPAVMGPSIITIMGESNVDEWKARILPRSIPSMRNIMSEVYGVIGDQLAGARGIYEIKTEGYINDSGRVVLNNSRYTIEQIG